LIMVERETQKEIIGHKGAAKKKGMDSWAI
jgi:GTPase Era involved in 16S rRNA processing